MSDITGFPELTVAEEIVMQRVIQDIKDVYQKYGYSPLETRLVEHADVLESKGIDGKEVFCLGRLHGGDVDLGKESKRVLALRFDLTVPLARFVSQNTRTLSFPFKRYQVQKVYRGEAAKEASGRFREFYQSDIDVIGANGKLSLSYDSEFPAVIYNIFRTVLGIDRFVMRINNRKFLEGLFAVVGVVDETRIKSAIKTIDNMEKVATEKTIQELERVNITTANAYALLELFRLCRNGHPVTVVDALTLAFANVDNDQLKKGVAELATVIKGVDALGVPSSYLCVDPSIARGLDYYSGTVYETILLDYPELGSVCSGGRYDELVGTLSSNKSASYPGCGISIGLSRLVPTLIRSGHLQSSATTVADVLITTDAGRPLSAAQGIAASLRERGVKVSVYYNDASLKNQLKYASTCGIPFVIIVQPEGDVVVRNMVTKTQVVKSIAALDAQDFVRASTARALTAAPVRTPGLADEMAEEIKRIMKL